MKLLFDENVSHVLFSTLADVFPGSEHVRDCGLRGADDGAIRQYAVDHDLVIVTKDDDFRARSVLHGHPPKVIWLTLGNCSTELIERLLREQYDTLAQFHADSFESLLTIAIE